MMISKSKLLNNQKRCFEKLRKYRVGALLMDAGTGKTRTSIELINDVEPDQVFWVCPFGAIDNIKKEHSKWGYSCNVIGVESIQQSSRLYLQLIEQIKSSSKPFLIMDESIKIKNPDAKRTRRMLRLSTMVDYKLILNGTPIGRNVLDIWSQFEFLSPKILNMSMAQFKNTFCEYFSMKVQNGRYVRDIEYIKKYHNLDYLYDLIEPYVFESKLSIDPNRQYLNYKYSLTDQELKDHKWIVEKYLDSENLMYKPSFFIELTNKLQNNYSRTKSKFRIVSKILSQIDQSKVIIYALYVETQIMLKEMFPNVLVLSYQKHTFSLNKQEYNHVIFFDKVWDYILRDQAESRVYRQGQKNDCYYYDLNANVKLDSLMAMNNQRKKVLLNTFKDMSNTRISSMIA